MATVKGIKVFDISDWVGTSPNYDKDYNIQDKYDNVTGTFLVKYLNNILYVPEDFTNQVGAFNDQNVLSDIYIVGYDDAKNQLYKLRLRDDWIINFEKINISDLNSNDLFKHLNTLKYIDLDKYITVSLEQYSQYTSGNRIKLSEVNSTLIPTNKQANIVKIKNTYVYLPPLQAAGYTVGYFDYKGKSYMINIMGDSSNGGMVSIVNLYDETPVIQLELFNFIGETTVNSNELTNYFVNNKPKEIAFNINNKKYIGTFVKEVAVDADQGIAAELYYTFLNDNNELCLLKVFAGPTGVTTNIQFTINKLTVNKSVYDLNIKTTTSLEKNDNQSIYLDDTESSKIKQFVSSGKQFINTTFNFTFGYYNDGFGNIAGDIINFEYINTDTFNLIPTYYFRGYYKNSIVLLTLRVPTEFNENVYFNKNVIDIKNKYTLDLKTTESLSTLTNKQLSTEDSNKFKAFINSNKSIDNLIINMNFGYYDDGTGDVFGDVVPLKQEGVITNGVNEGYMFRGYFNNQLVLVSFFIQQGPDGLVYFSSNVIS